MRSFSDADGRVPTATALGTALAALGLGVAVALAVALAVATAPPVRTSAAGPATTDIYVAPKDTPAFAAAEKKAQAAGGQAERTLQRALDRAAEALNKGGPAVVTVRIAAGEYGGKLGAGTFAVPVVDNPEGTLRILGGYGDDLEARAPFRTLTRLKTAAGRGGGILAFTEKSKLKELVVSGLVLDAAPSNTYDGKGNLLKDQSRTFPLVTFANSLANRLVVADNVFLNGAHGAFDPFIAPASAETTVEIRNNFFLNNVKAIQIGAGLSFRGNTVREVKLAQNTFISNWPYNPDPTSSNVGAVTLHNKESAQALAIEGNLFAYNPGGAMQHDWPEGRMPRVAIKGNLFFKNATLFGKEEPGDGAIVGKFGTNPKYLVLDPDAIEELSYDIGGNVALDPGIPVTQLLVVSSGDGDDVEIEGFAPAMELDPAALPVPKDAKAAAYGVQVDRPWAP